jgi:DNA polymerase I-like protein with 3'-5' exonuclease and polymerase domains
MASIEQLFGAGGALLGWNSSLYDKPRVLNHVPMTGPSIDGMVAWHILNTSLPKGLGFVTPFYVQQTSMWKHLSDSQPAFYNAKDADMALRNWIGIADGLKENKLWSVFERHVLQLDKALDYMSGVGLLRDNEMRQEAEDKLSLLLSNVELSMAAAVPIEARRLKVYKKTPKDIEGLIQVERVAPVRRCSICHLEKPKKAHFKPPNKKAMKLGLDNVCQDAEVVVSDETVSLWSKPLEWKISKVGLTQYQGVLRHQAVVDRKAHKTTFNEDAIVRLMKTYPNDPLYPLIIDHRNLQGHLTKYIGVTQPDGKLRGGMQIGSDNRIRTTFTHNPSTLRLAAQEPPLHQLPRPTEEVTGNSLPHNIASIIRNLIIAGPGQTLVAVDYAGIEAVLTGYFACDPQYIRLAKQDVHTYYTVYALHELDRRVSASDLPDISWPDDKLFPHLAELKKRFKKERNELYKHLVHAANFMQSPFGAQGKIFSETRIEYPLKMVAKIMDIYFSLFPAIKRWHSSVLQEAEKDGYLRNPFGYVHRFFKVYNWKKEFGKWDKKPNPDVANKVVAFKPQSTASGIIKEAILRLYFTYFEAAGQYLRLQVHDELLGETPKDKADAVITVMRREMELPVKELALPASYGMGSNLVVLTESKHGLRWGSMK